MFKKVVVLSMVISFSIYFLYTAFENYSKQTKQRNFEINGIATEINVNPNCFTQWVFEYKNYLYFSCWLYWESKTYFYPMWDWIWSPTKQVYEKANYFLEWITKFENYILQLTWKEWVIFKRDLNTLKILETIDLPNEIWEGWGITSFWERVFISNGTTTLFELDKDLKIVNRFQLKKEWANELEYFNGKIYWTYYEKNKLFSFDLKTLKEQELDIAFIWKKNWENSNQANWLFVAEWSLWITWKKWGKAFKLNLNEWF